MLRKFQKITIHWIALLTFGRTDPRSIDFRSTSLAQFSVDANPDCIAVPCSTLVQCKHFKSLILNSNRDGISALTYSLVKTSSSSRLCIQFGGFVFHFCVSIHQISNTRTDLMV